MVAAQPLIEGPSYRFLRRQTHPFVSVPCVLPLSIGQEVPLLHRGQMQEDLGCGWGGAPTAVDLRFPIFHWEYMGELLPH